MILNNDTNFNNERIKGQESRFYEMLEKYKGENVCVLELGVDLFEKEQSVIEILRGEIEEQCTNCTTIRVNSDDNLIKDLRNRKAAQTIRINIIG